MMSTSAKIGIPFFGGLMGYAYSFKNSVRSEKNYPNEWQKKAPVNYVEQTPKLPIHQRVLNQFHDHPIYIAAGVGIPFTVFVAFFQKKMSHLSTVQKFGNFRVLGQMGVLSIVLTTMSLEAFMLRRGKYEEEKQDENPSTA